MMDKGEKNRAKSFLPSFVVQKTFGKKSLFKLTGKKDGILNKKIQAYDVIIWDVYIFYEQLSSIAKNLNCIKLAQKAADNYC